MGVRAEQSSPPWVHIRQKSLIIASDFYGIQNHTAELRSTRAAMVDIYLYIYIYIYIMFESLTKGI